MKNLTVSCQERTEGGSTILFNVGAAECTEGERVLLVEANEFTCEAVVRAEPTEFWHWVADLDVTTIKHSED